MSETQPTSSDIPENIGRNSPCPCGSGRKYKSCCQRAHRLQRESEKQVRKPHQLIGSKTIPWKVFQVLQQVHTTNALGLFFEMGHDEGPFRGRFADKEAFVQAVDNGEGYLPVAPAFEFLHMRLDGPDTYLLLRSDDPKKSDVEFQIITLRPNELDRNGAERDTEYKGFRVWDYRTERLPRADLNGEVPPLETFDITWRPVAD